MWSLYWYKMRGPLCNEWLQWLWDCLSERKSMHPRTLIISFRCDASVCIDLYTNMFATSVASYQQVSHIWIPHYHRSSGWWDWNSILQETCPGARTESCIINKRVHIVFLPRHQKKFHSDVRTKKSMAPAVVEFPIYMMNTTSFVSVCQCSWQLMVREYQTCLCRLHRPVHCSSSTTRVTGNEEII
jgi:hypothetical protein